MATIYPVCSVDGCERRHLAKGLCSLHYERQRIASKPSCSVEGCARQAEKRGMCGAHYFRFRMHGEATAGRSPNGERKKFLLSFSPAETDQCIAWPFSGSGHGYGSRVGDLGYPHQYICEKFHGAKPTGAHEVAHGCGNRPCINPKHLRWALHVENEADKLLHGTHRSQIARRRA